MGTALVKLKIMPNSPEADMQDIQTKAEAIIKEIADEKRGIKFQTEEIAFGLKSLTASFAMYESHELEPIENKITALEQVTSAEVEDFRRAFG